MDGKIDLILTKSISRFARNTYDCIDMTRKLKVLGVDVIFEKENINTGRITSETELAALSSVAQEESISLSQNVRLGIRHRMKNGTFKQGCLPYGYYLGTGGEWKINEEQARIVRLIFNAYIGGMSLRKIADELKKAGVIKNDGTVNWVENRIKYIITNERYKGDALLQKTYTEEFPFKSRRNCGERDMYYVKNNNVPIVSAEIFDKANELLKAQSKRYRPSTVPREHTFAKMIYCGECGTMFRKKSGENNIFWVCRTRDHDSAECPTPQVAEKVLMNAFVNLYNRLVYNADIILAPMLNQLTEYKSKRMADGGEIENINKEIAELTEQVHVLRNAKANGYIEPASFMERMNEIASKTAKLKKDKKYLLG
ncbi:recombinase family protein, partial [Oscillospiraceae bacterium NSJ-50]|nr:recombinase family protein [Qingrenia yutianensis]